MRFSIHGIVLPAQKESQTALGWEQAGPGGDGSVPIAGGFPTVALVNVEQMNGKNQPVGAELV